MTKAVWKQPNNKDRARWARKAVKVYATSTGAKDNGIQSNVQDLIGDIRHLCWQRKINWSEVMRMATAHYAEESGLVWGPGKHQARCRFCGEYTEFKLNRLEQTPICPDCHDIARRMLSKERSLKAKRKKHGNQKRRR